MIRDLKGNQWQFSILNNKSNQIKNNCFFYNELNFYVCLRNCL